MPHLCTILSALDNKTLITDTIEQTRDRLDFIFAAKETLSDFRFVLLLDRLVSSLNQHDCE